MAEAVPLIDMRRGCTLVIVAAIAHVDMRLAEAISDQALDLLELRALRVAIERIVGETLWTHEPFPAARNCHADFVAELILPARPGRSRYSS